MRVSFLSLLLVLVPGLAAQTFTVTTAEDADDGACDAAHCSLREALAAANSVNGRVEFDAGLAGETLTLAFGQLDVTADVILDGADLGLAIDGDAKSRVLDIGADVTMEIIGLAIQNGAATDEDVAYGVLGGGILARSGSSLKLTRCILRDHDADGYGGGLYSEGEVHVGQSEFRDNYGFESGGGLFVEGSLVVSGSHFQGNGAGEGGAFAAYGPLQVTRSTFRDNEADGGDGGAIFARRTATVTHSTFVDNVTVSYGGAIAFAGPDGTLEYSTISDNEAYGFDGFMGGVYAYGALHLRHTTVVANIDGGIASRQPGSFEGNIVFANDGLDCSTGSVSSGFNVVGGACPAGGEGDVRLDTATALGDVLLPTLADNGGPTPTHALVASADNPAIDIGGACGPTDQRGEPAPTDGDGDGVAACDAGAVELAAGLVVATGEDPEAGLALRVSPTVSREVPDVTLRLAEGSAVRVTLLDVRGRTLSVLADGPRQPGEHRLRLADGLAPGAYFVRLEAGERVLSERFTVVR